MKKGSSRFVVGLTTVLGLVCYAWFGSVIPVQADELTLLVEDTGVTSDDCNGSQRADVAADSDGNVHIVWHDWREAGGSGDSEIYYKKLDKDGNTVIEDTRVTSENGYSKRARVATDRLGNVHIIWLDERDGGESYEVYYTKLDGSNGSALVEDTPLTSNSSSLGDWGKGYPRLAADVNGNVHVVWADDKIGGWEIYYCKLNGSNGNKMVENTRLTFDGSYSRRPVVAADSYGNVHVVWQDERNGSTELYYTKLDGSDGNTLVDDTRLTFDGAYDNRPDVEVDSYGNVHIVWRSHRDSAHEVYYTKLDNDGNTVVDDTAVTDDDDDNSERPHLALDRFGNVHVVWHDKRTTNGPDIFYAMLDNNGSELVEDTQLTSYSSGNTRARVAVDRFGRVHVVYRSWRDCSAEVFYTQGAVWLDSDGDGVIDDVDNCADTANADQADADGDAVGDACDICPGGDDNVDHDRDSVPDDCDNCPHNANLDQADADGDGRGDACDNWYDRERRSRRKRR